MKILHNIILYIAIFLSIAISQTETRNYDNELRGQNKAINALRDEIKVLQNKIKKVDTQERSVTNRISYLDEEITLIAKLIQALNKEEEKTKIQISKLKANIEGNEIELENLRIRYEKRIVNTYLKGSLTDLEKILSSTTWRQAMYRTHYLKIISDIEKEMTVKIERLLIDISQQKVNLEVALRNNLNLKRMIHKIYN